MGPPGNRHTKGGRGMRADFTNVKQPDYAESSDEPIRSRQDRPGWRRGGGVVSRYGELEGAQGTRKRGRDEGDGAADGADGWEGGRTEDEADVVRGGGAERMGRMDTASSDQAEPSAVRVRDWLSTATRASTLSACLSVPHSVLIPYDSRADMRRTLIRGLFSAV